MIIYCRSLLSSLFTPIQKTTMYVVLWLWFIVTIIAIICVIIIIMQYNTLVHLHKTCNATLQSIIDTRQKKWSWIEETTIQELITHLINTKTTVNQVKALNKLISYAQSVADSAIWKKIRGLDSWLSTEKRFYTNTARELNDRLASFPWNFIWPMINIKEYALITLNEEESQWILPEAKYL